MDADVAQLVREARLVEAAELASARGDARGASDLYERACEWGKAAREAMRAGDAARALVLAVQAKDDALAEAAVPAVAATAALVERTTAQLERRADDAWAARVFEAAGRGADAARAWARAGEAVRAARLFERVKDPAEAARVLEAQMRREPERWELHVALGTLLHRYGKDEAAVRTLQRVPEGVAERRRALSTLAAALEQLSMTQAAREAARELETLGGALPEESPAPEGPVKTRLFGRYEVVREVASSPTARVVECLDVVRGERVAVKIFAGYDARGAGRDALARFEREVRVLGALDHPSVVPLRDYFPEGPAIVLAWMGGGTLEGMLERGAIAPARAVEIAQAVLAERGEAHRLGVLHRDIKPANVLFDDAGVARLGDFGVAHLGDLSTTATAGVIGTLAYMSPEQREGRPATIQSDIYGAGAILLEMLTGEKPQVGEAPRTRPSAAHRDLDARHDDAVLAMANADPARRPADAFAARRALSGLSWPHAIERAAPVRREGKASVRPAVGRVEVTLDGRVIDRWVGRPIERVPLTERTLARASAFARAGHPLLQAVLRVDREAEEIWLEARRGAPLARPLTSAERALVRVALESLHEAGAAHGRVDTAHLLVDTGGQMMIRFTAEADPTSTVDLDRVALAHL
jgi:serine/threonine-protein kinase